jgi:hypothetical protein
MGSYRFGWHMFSVPFGYPLWPRKYGKYSEKNYRTSAFHPIGESIFYLEAAIGTTFDGGLESSYRDQQLFGVVQFHRFLLAGLRIKARLRRPVCADGE